MSQVEQEHTIPAARENRMSSLLELGKLPIKKIVVEVKTLILHLNSLHFLYIGTFTETREYSSNSLKKNSPTQCFIERLVSEISLINALEETRAFFCLLRYIFTLVSFCCWNARSFKLCSWFISLGLIDTAIYIFRFAPPFGIYSPPQPLRDSITKMGHTTPFTTLPFLTAACIKFLLLQTV